MAVLETNLNKQENESWVIKDQTEKGVREIGEVTYTIHPNGCTFTIITKEGFKEVMAKPDDKAAILKSIGELHNRFIEKAKEHGYFTV